MILRTVFAAAAFILLSLTSFGQDMMIYPLKAQKTLAGYQAIPMSDMSYNQNSYASRGGSRGRVSAGVKVDGGYIPCDDLYPSWVNQYVRYDKVSKPSQYRIDLSGYCNPVTSRAVSSHYGYRPSFGRNHYGTDISLNVGDTIRSAWRGRVRVVAYEAKGYGNYVVVRHENGLETVYGHMSRQLCRPNQWVEAGEPIGLGGNTGRSTGPHLHFETRFLGENIDPEIMFNFSSQQVKGDCYVYRNGSRGTLTGGLHDADAPLLAYRADNSHVVTTRRSAKQTETNASQPTKKESKKETKKPVVVAQAEKKNTTTEVVFTSEPTKKEVAKVDAKKDVAKVDSKATAKSEPARKEVAKVDAKKDVAKVDSKATSKAESAKKDVAMAESKADAKNSGKTDEKKGSYTVKKGETLYSIAKANNTTVEQLCKKNHISDGAVIKEGQVIRTM